MIFSNLQKRIKKVLFFWSKNFVMSKIVRNFASSEIKNDIRTLTYLAMAYIARVRKMQDLIKCRKLCLLSLFIHVFDQKKLWQKKEFLSGVITQMKSTQQA